MRNTHSIINIKLIFVILLLLLSQNTNISNAKYSDTIFYDPFEVNFDTSLEAGTWEKGISWGEPFQGTAEISNEFVKNGSNALKIVSDVSSNTDNVVIHELSVSNPVTITGWFHDSGISITSTAMISISKGNINVPSESYTHMMSIGILDGTNSVYEYRDDSLPISQYDTVLTRTNGWHEVKFIVEASMTQGYIDQNLVIESDYITFNSVAYIFLGDFWGTGSTMFFDEVSVVEIDQQTDTTTTTTTTTSTSSQNTESKVQSCLGEVDASEERPLDLCTSAEWTLIGVVGGTGIAILTLLFRRRS